MFTQLRDGVVPEPRQPFSLRRRTKTSRAQKRTIDHLVKDSDVSLAAAHLHALAISDIDSIPFIVKAIKRHLLPSSTRPPPTLYSHSIVLLHHLVLTVPCFYKYIGTRSFLRSFWRLHDSLPFESVVACNIRLLIRAWARDLHPNIGNRDSAAIFWVKTYLKLTRHYDFPNPPERSFVCKALPIPDDYASQFSYPSLRPSPVPTDGFEKALQLSQQLVHSPASVLPWQKRAISNIVTNNNNNNQNNQQQYNHCHDTNEFDDIYSPSCPVLKYYTNNNDDTQKLGFHKKLKHRNLSEREPSENLRLRSLLTDDQSMECDFISNDSISNRIQIQNRQQQQQQIEKVNNSRIMEIKKQERLSFIERNDSQQYTNKIEISSKKEDSTKDSSAKGTSTTLSTRYDKLLSVLRRHDLMFGNVNTDDSTCILPSSCNKAWNSQYDESTSTFQYSRITRSSNSTIVSFAKEGTRHTHSDNQGRVSVPFSYNVDSPTAHERKVLSIFNDDDDNNENNINEKQETNNDTDDLWAGEDVELDAPTLPAITPSSFAELVIDEKEYEQSQEFAKVTSNDLEHNQSWVPALEDVFQEVESASEALTPLPKNILSKRHNPCTFLTGEDEEVEEFVSGVLSGGNESNSSQCRLIARFHHDNGEGLQMIQ